MSEPLLAGGATCPQCGETAEPEQAGDAQYYACPECGAEFGYQRARLPEFPGPVCAAGYRFGDTPLAVDQPPGFVSLESETDRVSVFLGPTIRRRPE